MTGSVTKRLAMLKIILMLWFVITAETTSGLTNQVTVVGDTITFACNISTDVNWTFYSLYNTSCVIHHPTQSSDCADISRYNLSVVAGEAKLTISNTTKDDAGVYVCNGGNYSNTALSALLGVIESEAVIISNTTDDCPGEGETLVLYCVARYIGWDVMPLQLTWMTSDGLSLSNRTLSDNTGSIFTAVMSTTVGLTDFTFVCVCNFSAPTGNASLYPEPAVLPVHDQSAPNYTKTVYHSCSKTNAGTDWTTTSEKTSTTAGENDTTTGTDPDNTTTEQTASQTTRNTDTTQVTTTVTTTSKPNRDSSHWYYMVAAIIFGCVILHTFVIVAIFWCRLVVSVIIIWSIRKITEVLGVERTAGPSTSSTTASGLTATSSTDSSARASQKNMKVRGTVTGGHVSMAGILLCCRRTRRVHPQPDYIPPVTTHIVITERRSDMAKRQFRSVHRSNYCVTESDGSASITRVSMQKSFCCDRDDGTAVCKVPRLSDRHFWSQQNDFCVCGHLSDKWPQESSSTPEQCMSTRNSTHTPSQPNAPSGRRSSLCPQLAPGPSTNAYGAPDVHIIDPVITATTHNVNDEQLRTPMTPVSIEENSHPSGMNTLPKLPEEIVEDDEEKGRTEPVPEQEGDTKSGTASSNVDNHHTNPNADPNTSPVNHTPSAAQNSVGSLPRGKGHTQPSTHPVAQHQVGTVSISTQRCGRTDTPIYAASTRGVQHPTRSEGNRHAPRTRPTEMVTYPHGYGFNLKGEQQSTGRITLG